MKSTLYELNDPRLAEDVTTLNQAIEQTQNETLVECMEEAVTNGYFLIDVTDDGYTLEKLEVAN